MKTDWEAVSVAIAVMGMAISGLNIWVTLRIQLAITRMEVNILTNRNSDKDEMKRWAEEHFEPRHRHHIQQARAEREA